MIKMIRASIGYRGKPVIRDLDLSLEGRILLLGPNGAGKTTLLRGIAGVADIYSGRILVDGVDVSHASGAAGILGTNLPEVYYVMSVSSYDILDLYSEVLGVDRGKVEALLSEMGLGGHLLSKRKVWELSSGQQKAFTTSIALASGCRNILLDEPFEQLDPARKVKLLGRILESPAGTLVVTTHETWLLERLGGWSVYLVFEGSVFGPIEASKLARGGVTKGRAPEALMVIETSGGPISIVEEGGVPVTSLISLDRVYELLLGGGAG